MKTTTQLKTKIKNKFGTIERFISEQKSLKRWTIIHALQGRYIEKRRFGILKQIESIYKELDPVADPFLITNEEREFVRVSILIKFGSMRNFAKYSKFSQTFLSNVINGKKIRRDEKFNKLISLINKK